jgi:serine/threonine protein kinase
MPHTHDDPTIHVGLHLYDGMNYDTIVERVAYGGFGVIAFGKNSLNGGQMTAYKTLRRELLDDTQTRASFVRECLLWVGLWGHPNVTLTYAVAEMGDSQGLRPFLVLEYAEHGNLRGLLQRFAQNEAGGRLPLDPAMQLAQQIAAGLAYLHQPDPAYLRNEPMVHRDLKPENVLLMDDGRAVITDFGLAKAVEESPTALALLLAQSATFGRMSPPAQSGQMGTQAEEAILIGGEQATQTTGLHTARGMALGTMAYMAPEQWDDARYAGTPADIYALGIMLSEILAGRHALLDLSRPHTQVEWREAHRNPRPRALREVAPDVPEVVEAIYQRCLMREPGARPTAPEVMVALQAGGRALGGTAYTPSEIIAHTPSNEFSYWHVWSIAHLNFGQSREALARNDRALAVARQITAERPDALPSAQMTRGNIMVELGAQALATGKTAEAAEWDRQVEIAYQESLAGLPPATMPEGRRVRASVWNQIGVFNNERKRFNYAEDAYIRALTLQPNKSTSYYNRAKNQREWGLAEERAGHREAAIEHLRQARVYAVTSIGLGDPTAQVIVQAATRELAQMGVTDHA